MDVYDVAILGGGPAGTATALSLKRADRRLQVVIVEASGYGGWRAGETLAPGSRDLLASLGCWERFQAQGFLESHGTRAAWGSAQAHDNDFVFSLRGNGWHVHRAQFDALLAGAARAAGAVVLCETRFVHGERTDGDAWQLTVRRAGEPATLAARVVVDATGRAASFAVQRGARRVVDDRLAGVCTLHRFAGGVGARDSYTLVEAQEDGWWYSAVLPGQCIVAAWMSDTDLIRTGKVLSRDGWATHLARAPLTHARLASGGCAWPPRVWAARSCRLTTLWGEGWVATGDAAMAYDPLSSQGILKALQSGQLASYVVLDALRGASPSGARYEAWLLRDYEAYRATKRWYYRQEGRWPRSAFWARRG